MTSIRFSPKSRQDLLDIGDPIRKDSPINAQTFVTRLIAQCQKIALAPLGYPAREDLAPGLRMAAIDRYVIFFSYCDGTVRVERVLHGARNIPGLFQNATSVKNRPAPSDNSLSFSKPI